jgi:hypothetical protein
MKTLVLFYCAVAAPRVVLLSMSRSGQSLMVYLFNDLFLYARPTGWKYKLLRKIPIDDKFKAVSIPETKTGGKTTFAVEVLLPLLSCGILVQVRRCGQRQSSSR